MSISYSSTIKGFNVENYDEQKEPEKVKATGSKLMKIIIISAIVLVVISGIIILAVVLSKGGGSKKKGKYIIHPDENSTSTENVTLETDNVEDTTKETDGNSNYIEESENITNSTDDIYLEPKEINITYNEGQLKLFNIEKNISSKILRKDNETQDNEILNYLSILGIKNEHLEENINKTYYDGFFAILSSSYFNESNHKTKSLIYNTELINIILEKNQNKLRSLEELFLKNKNDDEDDEDLEKIKPFLKISFYKDGTYKNIIRPYNLSEEIYEEMKEFLDLIIPKISKDIKYVKKIDQKTIKKVREDNQKRNSLRNLNEKKSFNYIKILRKIDDQNNNGYNKIKDENSNDNFYHS